MALLLFYHNTIYEKEPLALSPRSGNTNIRMPLRIILTKYRELRTFLSQITSFSVGHMILSLCLTPIGSTKKL